MRCSVRKAKIRLSMAGVSWGLAPLARNSRDPRKRLAVAVGTCSSQHAAIHTPQADRMDDRQDGRQAPCTHPFRVDAAWGELLEPLLPGRAVQERANARLCQHIRSASEHRRDPGGQRQAPALHHTPAGDMATTQRTMGGGRLAGLDIFPMGWGSKVLTCICPICLASRGGGWSTLAHWISPVFL
eukprot:SAG25_NODE_60_length_18113_cov_233.489952_13_plen_185_part_00